MTSILALDPAWTDHEPSGVALLQESNGGWNCVGLAPSYEQFVKLADGVQVNWMERSPSGLPDVNALIATAQSLLGGSSLDLVTIDMPVSLEPICGRRVADNEVSRVYGGKGCGTHSPNLTRPGPIGQRLTDQFANLGYPLATTDTEVGHTPALAEVYPHPALLALLDRSYRVPYKISRARRYKKADETLAQRRHMVVDEWWTIHDKLSQIIGAIDLPIPSTDVSELLASRQLKRFEDALDALICGWVGVQYLEGHCTPYGDRAAAIWIP
jgi:predicted RNase H-like nuclease